MTMNRAPVDTTYFLVPGWKDEDFADEVGLGNIILDLKAPHVSISTPSAHNPVLALAKASKTKEVENFERVIGDETKRKIGLFAKILELISVGLNLSRTKTGSDRETYAVDKMTLKTFSPTKEFLNAVVEPDAVQRQLKGGESKSVFLITGTAVAEGVTYTSKISKEKEIDGSLGVGAHGVNVGPSGNDWKKQILERKETHPGPFLLAFRVQKIQLGANAELEASPHDGEFYGEDEEEEQAGSEELVYNAELSSCDKSGMNVVETVLDITDGDDEDDEMECRLVFPKNFSS
jgi:hypothetical protein